MEDEDGCPEEDLNSLFQAIVTGEYTVPDFVSDDAKELLEVRIYTKRKAANLAAECDIIVSSTGYADR